MLLEITSLVVPAEQQTAFELAFHKAQARIAGSSGYVTHELQRDVQDNGRYALLIEWRSDRPLPADTAWQAPLQGYFEQPPRTDHYRLVAGRGVPPPGPALHFPD